MNRVPPPKSIRDSIPSSQSGPKAISCRFFVPQRVDHHEDAVDDLPTLGHDFHGTRTTSDERRPGSSHSPWRTTKETLRGGWR